MTDTRTKIPFGAGAGALDGIREAAARNPATDRLMTELQGYLAAQGQRLLVGLGHKLGETTVKLNDVAEGRSPGFAKLALEGGRKIAQGKGPLRTALELGAGRLKDRAKEGLKGLVGKGGKKKGRSGTKPTVILERVDVGVPLREAYNQWTQFQEFNSFAKGVKSATRADETTSDWNAKIFWSSRSWKAHTTEQIPDQRIAWTSEGAKGTVKGVVTFHSLDDRLTRVLLIMEYYPTGLFEKTGNIWRAQGRRARLDLKNFARFVTFRGEATDGWRGEIRDGEVVRDHDEVVAEEERYENENGPEDEDRDRDRDEAGDEYEDEEDGEAEPRDEEDGEPEDEYDEDEAAPEDEYEDEDEEEPEYEEEPRDEEPARSSRR